MKKLILLAMLVVSPLALQAEKAEKAQKAQKAQQAQQSDKKTDLSFSDVLVKGKYDYSLEAEITVEQDKVLEALIKVRKNFDDRVEASFDSF